MSTLAFDTHRFITDLKKAGMKAGQAEAVVSHISAALDERLATKDDIKDMARKADIELLESRLWNKVLAALLAHAAIVVGAVIAAFLALA